MTRAWKHRASHHQIVGARAFGKVQLPLAKRRRFFITMLVTLACATSLSMAPMRVEAEGAEPVSGAGVSGLEGPPARICGNAAVLDGPATAPSGAVVVSPGDNSVNDATYHSPPGTTFWLAPGTHLLGSGGDIYGQVIPKDGNRYIGAPGAILDGQNVARYAFTQQATNVTISYLTIQHFGGPLSNKDEGVVNHDAGTGWLIEHNTIQRNGGAGVFVGSDNIIRYNCLSQNGQYGFSSYKPPVAGGAAVTNITLDHNEIVGNNTDDWETRGGGCGCTGGGKFWDTQGAAITSNWVHHNRSVGLWADTNNIGFNFDGNYINDNDSEGIWYEISYNARIANNTFKRNALVKGRATAARGDNFPIGAIYLSESGGDSRVNGGVYSTLAIVGNDFQDNWGGVVLWENADRFCASPANTSGGYCTRGNPEVTLATCGDPASGGRVNTAPYYDDCRWKTKNVLVSNNDFRIDKAALGCAANNFCGQQGVLSNYGTYPAWSPYQGSVIGKQIAYQQNNRFINNRYTGDWFFTVQDSATKLGLLAWQSAPYNQDEEGAVRRVIDTDSSSLEGSIGLWAPWYSARSSRSELQAHSGTHSLRVEVTAPWGWGVQANNWPGFRASGGARTASFWARAGGLNSPSVHMRLNWRNVVGHTVQSDLLTLGRLTASWQQVTVDVTAPVGTTSIGVDLVGGGAPGDILYVDDIDIR